MSPARGILVVLFLFGAVVAWLSAQPIAAVIFVGVGIGALLVETVAVQPVGDLLRSCAPLTMPLLVIAVVGAIDLGTALALAAGILFAVIAWTLVVRPELADEERTDPRLRAVVLRVVLGTLGFIGAVLLAGAVIGAGVADPLRARETLGGSATRFFVAGVGLWAAAVVLRLLSYGRNPARIVIALSLGTTFVSLVVSTGIVEGSGKILGAGPPLLLAIAGGALVVEILWVGAKEISRRRELIGDRELGVWIVSRIDRWRGQTPPGSFERFWQRAGRRLAKTSGRLRRFGFEVALLASAVIAMATVVALKETADQGTDSAVPGSAGIQLQNGPAPEQIARAAGRGRHARTRALARAYMPVLAFTEDQPWSPTSVDRYLAHPALGENGRAVLTGPVGTRRPASAVGSPLKRCNPDALVTPCEPRTVAGLPTRCPGLVLVPCYHLTINCSRGTLDCARPRSKPRRRARPYRDGAVYVRVLTRGRSEPGSAPEVFSDLGPFRSGRPQVLWTIVQYWYFYRYNEWRQRVLPGELIQRHEADWEVVTVGLSRRQPLFVAYSSHCAGSWRQWTPQQIPAASTPPPTTHPVIAVAKGSQANYPKADQERVPNWDRCARVTGLTAGLISYAANVRDRTAYAWQWKPRKVIVATASAPPMSFPGTWGGHDETRLVNNARRDALARGNGPKTPTLQALWHDPVRTIFCSPAWTYPPRLDARKLKATTCRPKKAPARPRRGR